MLPVKMKVFGPGVSVLVKEAMLSRIAAKAEMKLMFCAAAKSAVGESKVDMGFSGLEVEPYAVRAAASLVRYSCRA